MNNEFRIDDFVPILTKQSVMINLKDRFIERRKEQGISQKMLAKISNVSYASIRRFESTCEISLSSLISISKAINCMEDFNELFSNPVVKSLNDYRE